MVRFAAALCLIAVVPPTASTAQKTSTQPLPPALQRRIDTLIQRSLLRDGTPSAQVSIVQDGHIVYDGTFGAARLMPRSTASQRTHYQFASVSKMFTAQAVLLLEAEGRLRLDDTIDRWYPAVTEAQHITVRQLLTHTAGLPDHYPMGYPAGPRSRATTPDDILHEWGSHPLLTPPGQRFHYSNLDYMLAGRIVEKVSGTPLFEFMQQRIFTPLGMSGIADLDKQAPADPSVATGYTRTGLAALREGAYEGPGWSYGAGQLLGTAHDLALWDVAFLKNTLLAPPQAKEQVTAGKLNDGSDTAYAMGLFVSHSNGVSRVYHSGQSIGFLTINDIFPDARLAIIVLTNTSVAPTYLKIDDALQYLLLPPSANDARARQLWQQLATGKPDRSRFTADLNTYLRGSVLTDLHDTLRGLGPVESFALESDTTTDGLETRDYSVAAGGRAMHLHLLLTPQGKLEDVSVTPAE